MKVRLSDCTPDNLKRFEDALDRKFIEACEKAMNDDYRHWMSDKQRPGVGEKLLWIMVGMLLLAGALAWAYYCAI